MTISYAPYHLDNLHNHAKREGFLIRFQDSDGLYGVGDCHPWPELGDLTWKDQVELLKELKTTQILKESLKCAFIDLEAKRNNHSLWKGLEVPESHFLFMDLLSTSFEDIQDKIDQGFHSIKAKVKGTEEEREKLVACLERFPIKWSFDFNHRMTETSFDDWIRHIEPYRIKIDYIEDPYPFDAEAWKSTYDRWHIPLAFDRGTLEDAEKTDPSTIIMVKPAIQPEEDALRILRGGRKVVVTSYLDHPIGQLYAGWKAAIWKKKFPNQVHIAGLLTQWVYKKTSFSDAISIDGPYFKPPQGLGFGWEPFLNQIIWTPLCTIGTKLKV